MPSDHRFALLADTHVGDRVKRLDPALYHALLQAQPEAILHAGDVCNHTTITQLSQIAPVYAVMGNRDWLRGHYLPMAIHAEVNGVKITLTHGHLSLLHYAGNYLRLFFTGAKTSLSEFQKKLARKYPYADVIIYGHTHYQIDMVMDGKRFINPGAAIPQKLNDYTLQYMLLTITATGEVITERRALKPTADG